MSAAALAAAAIGGGQADAAVPRQTGGFTYTATTPGTATGTVADFRFRNPENPSQKPHTVARMVIRAPAGVVVDTTLPPQCHASDAELMVLGPAACPSNTKIGSGFVISDTGGGGPFPRYTRTTISDFNNQGEIIGVGVNDDIPAIKSVDHTKIEKNGSTTNFPSFPGAPPPDPYTPIKRLHIAFPRYARGGRAYQRTPPTCPAVRYWTLTITFTYKDGVTQQLVSHSPCKPGHRKPKPRRPPGTWHGAV